MKNIRHTFSAYMLKQMTIIFFVATEISNMQWVRVIKTVASPTIVERGVNTIKYCSVFKNVLPMLIVEVVRRCQSWGNKRWNIFWIYAPRFDYHGIQTSLNWQKICGMYVDIQKIIRRINWSQYTSRNIANKTYETA